MKAYLKVRYFDSYRGAEFPPSPLQLIQAIIASSQSTYMDVLQCLESQTPAIYAVQPAAEYSYSRYVSNNDESLEHGNTGTKKTTTTRVFPSAEAKATSLSEAVMFRLIDAEAPTLLLDEAETIEGRSDRSEALRAVAHEGYKKGGQVPRCDGEDHQVRFFDVFCPKVFAAIGGLTGALLDRCIVIHLEKAPRASIRKSTRYRALRRDTEHLVSLLEAYALQFAKALVQLYEGEPDCGYWRSIADREGELWGPLLIHARLAGPDLEAKLLGVVNKFSEEKAEIKSTDSKIAQTIAMLDAISQHPNTLFTPGDLVPSLAQSEAWGKVLADVKGRDEDTIRVSQAARVGLFLRNFRLRGKKNSTGHMAYDKQTALASLSAHVPGNPPNPRQSFVLQGQGSQDVGQGEDNMIVGYGQQFGGTFRQPRLPRCGLALGAIPIQARVVRDGPLSAAIALFDVSPECRCTASHDGTQHFQVESGQPVAMLFSESYAVCPNNVGHLQRRPNHFSSEGFLVKFKLSRGLAVAPT